MSIWKVSTIDIVAIAVAITFGFLWIENHHRITLEPRLETESALAAGTEACSANDNIPYSARCLAFLDDGTSPPWRVTSVENNAALASILTLNGGAGTAGSPCPDTDQTPYTARCLAFLKGATELGMRWRITAPDLRTRVDMAR